MPAGTTLSHRAVHAALCLLFLLSGTSGLIYETAWTRLFQEMFGHDVHTTSAVLAAFMAGLGLGALLGGRLADRCRRPVRLYGWIELALAVLVWSSPWQLALLDRLLPGLLGSWWASPGPGDTVRWGLAFVLLLLPTALMGATLPLLCRALIRDEREVGRSFGLLYGCNTIGAVAGVLAAGCWLILHLGVVATIRSGCTLSVVAGLAALLLSRYTPEMQAHPTTRQPSVPEEVPADHRLGLVASVVLISGFTTLAYEVLWIRSFVFLLGSSVLSFSLVLAGLLGAMGIGSLLMPLLIRNRSRHLPALGWIEIALGCSAAATVPLLLHIDEVLAWLGPEHDLLGSLGGRALLVVLLVLPPGLLMGALLPAASGAIRSAARAGRGIGLLYGATTAGNISGSLVAGYLLAPLLGSSRAILLLAGINAALGVLVLAALGWRRRSLTGRLTLAGLAPVALLVAVLVAPETARSLWARKIPHARMVAASEGLRGTVTVHEVAPLPLLSRNRERSTAWQIGYGYHLIAVDGVTVAGTAPDLRTTQRLQADIPLLLHGSPRQVLQIGYGSGETTAEARRHPLASLHLVEINPDVITTANHWFPEHAGAEYQVFFTDAKSFVRTTSNRYDVILNDSTYPGISGSSQLYSQDHLHACRERLRPGGVVSTWLPIDLPPETFRLVLATFRSVFPECSFWLATGCWNKHGVLVGSLEPQQQLLAQLRSGSWPAAVQASLAELGYGSGELLAAAQVLDSDGIRRLSEGMPVNSDDRPFLEYPARGVQISGEQFWSETLQLIVAHLAPAARTAGRGVHSATGPIPLLLAGQLALLENDPELALRFYARAGRQWPEHPGAANLTTDILVFRAQAAFSETLDALRRNDPGTALAALQTAVRLCPYSATARFELGRLLAALDRPAEAAPQLQECLASSDEIPEARELLERLTAAPAGQG